jgi:hypothetical protein
MGQPLIGVPSLADRQYRGRECEGRLLGKVVARIDHAVLVAGGEHAGLPGPSAAGQPDRN